VSSPLANRQSPPPCACTSWRAACSAWRARSPDAYLRSPSVGE
jgi:iron-sulfur cluster repair protein YtfE (RIC family)